MFGAPPVGHVMDPQFKPLFFGVMEICMQMQVCSINPINGRLRGIYQIFRHIFSIIQYSPLKYIQIANRWTYSHRQNYGKKNNYGKNNYGKKKVRNFSIIDRRRL